MRRNRSTRTFEVRYSQGLGFREPTKRGLSKEGAGGDPLRDCRDVHACVHVYMYIYIYLFFLTIALGIWYFSEIGGPCGLCVGIANGPYQVPCKDNWPNDVCARLFAPRY